MGLTRKELAVVIAAGVLGLTVAVAIALDSWRWSLALTGLMQLALLALVILILRRQDQVRAAGLLRVERKIDNVAMRVVAESQATHHELSSMLEELRDGVRERERG